MSQKNLKRATQVISNNVDYFTQLSSQATSLDKQVNNVLDNMEIGSHIDDPSLVERHPLVSFEPLDKYKYTMPEQLVKDPESPDYDLQSSRVYKYYCQCSQYFKKGNLIGKSACSLEEFWKLIIFKDRRPINPAYRQIDPIPTTLQAYKCTLLDINSDETGVDAKPIVKELWLCIDIIRASVNYFCKCGNYQPTDIEVLNNIKNMTRFNLTNDNYNDLYTVGIHVIKVELKKLEIRSLPIRNSANTLLSRMNQIEEIYNREHDIAFNTTIFNTKLNNELFKILDSFGSSDKKKIVKEMGSIKAARVRQTKTERFMIYIINQIQSLIEEFDWSCISKKINNVVIGKFSVLLDKYLVVLTKLREESVNAVKTSGNYIKDLIKSVYKLASEFYNNENKKDMFIDFYTKLATKTNKSWLELISAWTVRILYVAYRIGGKIWDSIKKFFNLSEEITVKEQATVCEDEQEIAKFVDKVKNIKTSTKTQKQLIDTVVEYAEDHYLAVNYNAEEAANTLETYMINFKNKYDNAKEQYLLSKLFEEVSVYDSTDSVSEDF